MSPRLPVSTSPSLSSGVDIADTNGQYLREPGTHQSGRGGNVEVTKALAALQPLYGKDNVEIITIDGRRIRGTVRSMKTTQALTTPSVKILCADGQIVKIPFPTIAEIKSHT